MGDFNVTLWQSEHFSATQRSEKQMADFGEVLDWCDLSDLGYHGQGWTYDNIQGGSKNVKARMDRAFLECTCGTYLLHQIGSSAVAPAVWTETGIQKKERVQVQSFMGKRGVPAT